MVAGYLVRECAIITAEELALDVCASDSQIDLSLDVYAHYVSIEGILYVQSLHNASRSESEGEEERLFDARQGRLVRNIYVGYDHLGVRDILFVSAKDDLLPPRHTIGVWWTELAREDGILRVATETDVSRLLSPSSHSSHIF